MNKSFENFDKVFRPPPPTAYILTPAFLPSPFELEERIYNSRVISNQHTSNISTP